MAGKSSLSEARGTAQKINRIWFLAGVLITVLVAVSAGGYAWFTLSSRCDVNAVAESSTFLQGQWKRFDHVYQFTITASRDSVVLPLAALQQILMDTKDVGVPACMQTTKEELIHYMRTVNQAFQAYGSGEGDAAIRTLIDEAYTHLDAFTTELDAVKECAPYCLP